MYKSTTTNIIWRKYQAYHIKTRESTPQHLSSSYRRDIGSKYGKTHSRKDIICNLPCTCKTRCFRLFNWLQRQDIFQSYRTISYAHQCHKAKPKSLLKQNTSSVWIFWLAWFTKHQHLPWKSSPSTQEYDTRTWKMQPRTCLQRKYKIYLLKYPGMTKQLSVICVHQSINWRWYQKSVSNRRKQVSCK